jgi:hypothetical protein
VVAHSSAVLQEGYFYCGENLWRRKPDLLVNGRSFVMDRPEKFIGRFRKWSCEMRDAFRALSAEGDYRYGYDPFWVRAEPYRVTVRSGDFAEV